MTLTKRAPWMMLLMALVLVLSACGGAAPSQPAAGEATAAPEGEAAAPAEGPTATPVIEFAQEPSEGQKVLVWTSPSSARP
jgi:multiple sugar transport system substrate-binding protein